jgi:hypothetical protein
MCPVLPIGETPLYQVWTWCTRPWYWREGCDCWVWWLLLTNCLCAEFWWWSKKTGKSLFFLFLAYKSLEVKIWNPWDISVQTYRVTEWDPSLGNYMKVCLLFHTDYFEVFFLYYLSSSFFNYVFTTTKLFVLFYLYVIFFTPLIPSHSSVLTVCMTCSSQGLLFYCVLAPILLREIRPKFPNTLDLVYMWTRLQLLSTSTKKCIKMSQFY